MARKQIIFEPWYFPHNPNFISTTHNFLTPAECKRIIEVGDKLPVKDATTANEEDSRVDYGQRKCAVSWISQDHPELQWFWNKIHDAIVDINNQNRGFDLKFMDEEAQYTVYKNSNDHFDYHMDNGPRELSVRKLSIVVNLNDPSEWEGGSLQSFGDVDAPQGLGSLHVFPSYLLHRVTPLISGTRKSLVLWCGGSYYK